MFYLLKNIWNTFLKYFYILDQKWTGKQYYL